MALVEVYDMLRSGDGPFLRKLFVCSSLSYIFDTFVLKKKSFLNHGKGVGAGFISGAGELYWR